MPYSPTAWINNQAPALSAANLNKLTDELESQAAAQGISHALPTWADGVAPALTDAAPLNEMERVLALVATSVDLSYAPTTWSSGWTPARNATRLNRMEQQAALNRAEIDSGTTGGYTSAAAVDLSRNPIPPQSSTVQNITAPITISTAVSDRTFNVTSSFAGSAINVTSTGSLTRCVVNCLRRCDNGVTGSGTVTDVKVTGALAWGFFNVRNFAGCCSTTGNGSTGTSNSGGGFRHGGAFVVPADCLLKSDDDYRWGHRLQDVAGASCLGVLAGINTGDSVGINQATGVQAWSNVRDSTFNIFIGNACPGYGVAWYGSTTANNEIAETYCLAQGAGGDPALSIGGGAHDNVFTKHTSDGYLIGLILGEDVDPSPFRNRVKTLDTRNGTFPGIIMDRGAYDNVVGEVGGTRVTNHGTSGDYQGAIHIANRGGQTNTPPHGNTIHGLVETHSSIVPEYAIYLGSGTTGNVLSGTAQTGSLGKIRNDGSGNTVSVT